MTRPPSLTVRAAAKLNLHLGVGGPREDGYHPLATVYQAVSLYDDLTGHRAPGLSVDLTAARHVVAGDVPSGEGNIVARAAALLEAHHGVPLGATVTLHKEIPVAGGLAGGSADAAAALVLLDRLWELDTPEPDLLRLAGALGSDVPFALVGGTAVGSGRGELVTPTADPGTWWWVVVPSPSGLSTPAVYRHWDRLHPDGPVAPASVDRMVAAVASGDPRAVAAALHNDLQVAALDLRPDLGALLARGEAEGALGGQVTGSGPTCVFLCEDGDHARAVAAGLRGAGRPVAMVATGPVAGAHLVVA